MSDQPEQLDEPTPPALPAGDRWGDPITPERQADLKALADQQRAWAAASDHQGRESYFKDVRLTGADVFWLAGYALAGPDGDLTAAQERLRTASDRGEYIDLSALHLEGANLYRAHLEGANLSTAHLERADLRVAHLEGADLLRAHLEGADLRVAHLERADLRAAQLARANLRFAWLDGKTQLANVTLGEARSTIARLLRRKPKWGNASLGDIRWGGPPDLTQVHWESLQRLGDEAGVGWRTPAISATGLDHRDVVRAYRQVAAQLRAQGLSEEADRFAERAQIRKRKQTFRQMLEDWRRPWRFPLDALRWLFSWFLAVLAGYGYHPGRSVFWYLATIVGFAFAYYQLGPAAGHTFQPDGAVVFSLTSFHGRGFFPGSLDIESLVTKLAAIEAVIGLIIEISFIATFTQRFFAR